MKVSEVMETDVVTASPDETVSEVARSLRENDVSGMPVVEDNVVLGVVSEADLLDLIDTKEEEKNIWLPSPFEAIELPLRAFPLREWLERHDIIEEELEDIGEMPVRDVMTRDVKTASADDTVEDASHLMVNYSINRLPVLDEDGDFVGIVTREDILEGIVD
ncbi:MAG: CBS domain-containing protein [Halobacteria archaeon]|nr:CBS domain-containing protein [Halobacteria archaeon]